MLQEIEEKKRQIEEEFAQKRATAKANREAPIEAVGKDVEEDDELSDLMEDEEMEEDASKDSNPMSALLASARARAAKYQNNPDDENDDMDEDDEMDEDASEADNEVTSTNVLPKSGPQTLEFSRRAFDKIFKNVLSTSDILLYVLDARDPNGTRSREIEREVTAADAGSKRLILILNKIDLVPPSVLKAWLVYLRRYFPTLPLRANTSAPNAHTFDHKALTVKGTSETLLRALKSYAQAQQLKRSVTIGIIGYPNVGKSSVVNALTSRLGSSRTSKSACPVGAEAGVTTALREVKLDNKLKLLDSPGIVFPSSSSTANNAESIPHFSPKQLNEANLTLLSALPPSAISDPTPAITLLLHRLSRSEATLAQLLEQYDLAPSTIVSTGPKGDITTDFLIQVARKRGRLGKGGVPNLQSAAMGVLMDWRDGRIRGWTEAPKEVESGESNDLKEIVKEWAKEFKLEGLWGDEGGEAMEQ